ncbi:hypothetical protein WJX77_003650 [Trebouxia sp. C0004]
METIDSTISALSPSFSHIGTGRHSNQASSESSLLASPRIVKTERRLQTQTPADTVLTHFRIVRQQDQALQSQRHTALQRLNHLQCTAATRQQIVAGRADAHLPVLACRSGSIMPPNLLKDAMLLADRARSQHVRGPEGTASTVPRRMLSRPATSAAVGHTGRLTPQRWAPAPCSIACTSFRQSLPPHAHAQSSGHGVASTSKIYTPIEGLETSLRRRTAYGEVLRRVKSAHGAPTPVKVQQHGAAGEALGPWSN